MRRDLGLALVIGSGAAALIDGAFVLRDVLPTAWRAPLVALVGEGRPLPPVPSIPAAQATEHEPPCPRGGKDDRAGVTIEGVEVDPSLLCDPDDPYAVAAFVKGTNNVSDDTLMRSSLARDAVNLGRDLDGDGDPDEVEIRLEVAELNGFNPDGGPPIPGYAIAPGITPGFWTFAPKHRGMATVSLESGEAMPLLRVPSPTIRVEQGDRVRLVLENTHYLPHTIHLHGVDHAFLTKDGQGNDGVPMFTETPLPAGQTRVYETTLRHPGTMFYHCHVEEQAHVPMGLAGMFVVEENRPDNWLQTLNIGAGEVRHRSVAVREAGYAGEHDLVFADVDRELNNLLQTAGDPRTIERHIHRDYNITQAMPEYFLLNGRSFPYTLRDSLIPIEPGQRLKLRLLDAASDYVTFHPHGHKVLVTHTDGVAVPPGARERRDVVGLLPGQRLDVEVEATDDGLHSDGPGLWMVHDHRPKAVTNDGVGHGGTMTFLAYPGFLDEEGMPRAQPGELAHMFSRDRYVERTAGYAELEPGGLLGERGVGQPGWGSVLRVAALPVLLAGMVLGIRGTRGRPT